MVKLYTTEEGGSVSFEGTEYRVKNGMVDVPENAVPILLESHGFTARKPNKRKALAEEPEEETVPGAAADDKP